MYVDTQLDEYNDIRLPRGLGGVFYGVYPAIVVDLDDPSSIGRVLVRLPWSPDTESETFEVWARIATLMGGNNRGTWFIPDVDDEVLVAFAAGDPRWPYVVGGLWNGNDAPPQTIAQDNNIKQIRSRNGVAITFDDAQGQENILVETPGGQKVTLKDGPGAIEIEDSNGNRVTLESSGITLNASAKVTISGSVVEISAGTMTVNAGMSQFNGVAKADTVISPSVVGSSYTPGAGNIW